MKILSIIFLALGVLLLIVMGFQMVQPGERGDNLTWLSLGPPVIALFCFGAGLALLIASRKQRRK